MQVYDRNEFAVTFSVWYLLCCIFSEWHRKALRGVCVASCGGTAYLILFQNVQVT